MKKQSRSQGQSILEFALIFPLLFFMITGLFDLGRAVVSMSMLNTAVREATRDAIVLSWSTANKDQSIMASLTNYLWLKELKNNCQLTANPVCQVTVAYLDTTPPTDPTDPFDPKVAVTVVYQFKPITPGMAALLGSGGSIPITVKSEMYLAPVAKPPTS